jgi:hypothetical protein
VTKNILETIQIKISELHKNLTLLKTISTHIKESNIKDDMVKYWGIVILCEVKFTFLARTICGEG